MRHHLPALALFFVAVAARAAPVDSTAAALQHCLDDPANAATSGQTTCVDRAAQSYDQRMNIAYRALLRRLPPASAQRLRVAQREWLAFRAADTGARSAWYETRQGTMYVPMQADAEMGVLRDRTLQLENDLRVLQIE